MVDSPLQAAPTGPSDQAHASGAPTLGFLPVDVSILNAASRRPFDLYVPTSGGRKVLFCAQGMPLARSRLQRLVQNQTTLYVPHEQSGELQAHLERVLEKVIADDRTDVEQRGRVLYGAAQAAMSDIMANPTSPNTLRRGTRLAGNVLQMVVRSPKSLHTLAGLFSTDYYTYTHSIHTCILGASLCQRVCDADGSTIHNWATGFLLHDIGKCFVRAEVLNKPGKLDPQEWEEMRLHPMRGYELLRRQEGVSQATLRVVLQHHEKCDGSGYPNGLDAEALDTASRIVCLVDMFDALTTSRVYRPAMSYDKAMGILQEDAAKGQLDSNLLARFRTMTDRLPLWRKASASRSA